MKALLLVLTAFFLQSCYTILYTPSEYSATGDAPYCPPSQPVIVDPRPPRPYIPAPPPAIQIPANMPVDQPDARPRNNDQARNQTYGTLPEQRPQRVRTETAPTNSAPAPSNVDEPRPRNEAASGSSNAGNAANENPARLRTPTQQAADNNTQPARTETRERTTPQTQQNDTPTPRSR